jgi:hypothetical protein
MTHTLTSYLDNSTYERFLEEDESATHTSCDCAAIAYLRYMEPSDYYDAPINKFLRFIQRVGLIKG